MIWATVKNKKVRYIKLLLQWHPCQSFSDDQTIRAGDPHRRNRMNRCLNHRDHQFQRALRHKQPLDTTYPGMSQVLPPLLRTRVADVSTPARAGCGTEYPGTPSGCGTGKKSPAAWSVDRNDDIWYRVGVEG
ncbi:hypothetical protein RRG08_004781 [Elysia crispata]|uniref:Uncharacterized protein n=1 Tax=Elysia crispata TaxID=231223 RepID=A0AAE1AJV9_9GAST|nr:hypothetical protein RRG08_004781 [Elysia crispata]